MKGLIRIALSAGRAMTLVALFPKRLSTGIFTEKAVNYRDQ